MFKFRFFAIAAILLQGLFSPLKAELKKLDFDESFGAHYRANLEVSRLSQICKKLWDYYHTYNEIAEEYIIPKHVHFIWLGSPLPEPCRKVVESWKFYHPEWTVRVWTDEDVPPLNLQNQHAYDMARNWGEKSDILRLELLYRYGGVYIDSDFECLQPFDDLHRSCEFYTGIIGDVRHECLLNGLVGSRPGHPIIKACMENLRVGNGDHDSQRIMTYSGPYLFTEMFLKTVSLQDLGKVLVLPPHYLYAFPAVYREEMTDREEIKREFARPESLAIHYWSTAWQKNR